MAGEGPHHMNPNVRSTITDLAGRRPASSPPSSPAADRRLGDDATVDLSPSPPADVVRPVADDELLAAIAADQLVLHHQPILELASGRTVEVEALVRWAHPERGMLSPGTFVPQAERSGLVVELGRWVLDAGCRQLRAWRDAGIADDLVLAVNVSPRQLDEPTLVGDVLASLGRHGVPPEALMLEITEGLPVQQGSGALGRIGELRRHGLGIAVDDFGTGHSWIGSVRRFGIDVLKIDRSFVAQVGQPGGEALMSSLVDLGKAVGAQVVAEGIETQEQLDLLRRLDCDLGQGFYLARPMPADALGAHLARQQTPFRRRLA
jgi:EAL domain-containing protein (putative c-di-GMP-specific phosphodiesterase class I)